MGVEMSKYKFTYKRRTGDIVYGDAYSTMAVGTIAYYRKAPTWAKGNKYVVNVSWASEWLSAFRTQQEARAFLEQRFTETFLGGRDKSTEAGEVGSTDA